MVDGRRRARAAPLLRAGAALCAAAACNAYNYFPGMELRDYAQGEAVGPIKVNSLFSHDGIVSYDYYSLKHCSPPKEILKAEAKDEKLGEIIWGDRIEPSLYYAEMMKDVKCRLVECSADQRKVSATDLARFDKRINNGYRGAFVLDNLPIISNGSWIMNGQCPSGEQIYDYALRGYALGVPKRCIGKKTYINNHLALHIHANEHEPGRFIIVGFNVIPYSVLHPDVQSCSDSFRITDNHPPVTTDPAETKEIIWSYSVQWHRSAYTWNNRWDAYLSLAFANSNARVHWLSIINSLLIILCLSAIVAMILLRTLHMDFNRYNNPEDADEAQEEVGWKLVHADVFRTPKAAPALAIFVGTGVQLIGMFGLSMFFAMLGFLSPANRGGLITATMLLFVLMSLANGFTTGIILRMFQQRKWKTVFLAGLAYPGVMFGLWLAAEFTIWISRGRTQGANTAPLLSVLSIMGLWFGISLPLVVLGASFGFRGPEIEHPCKVQKLARQIPPQRWYLQTAFLTLGPGIIPFGAAFIELRFILSSIWQGMVYYVFGFLGLTFVTVTVTIVEVTIVLIYFLLVFEDYRWWWTSVIIPGGMSVHFFLYGIFYFFNQLRVRTWIGTYIYFQTMALISLSLYVVVGTIGFIAAFVFVRKIYSSIKVE
eukprot:TRINITY_DN983_c0_g1_i5.p1 TRINITY_DN983_c0_g1~~TRINITY_DN983_c0_g1_i5.p1  ORF type:complete len:654 (+),score=225.88 TRINITY_DN983_c0_g1_i5:87-2048(+)